MELAQIEFKRFRLSATSTGKLQQLKAKTGLTPNIACRLALGLSLAQKNPPALELYSDESGQEISRQTLMGDLDGVLEALTLLWCHENKISINQHYEYFAAHINRGVELLFNRLREIGDLGKFV